MEREVLMEVQDVVIQIAACARSGVIVTALTATERLWMGWECMMIAFVLNAGARKFRS